MCFYHSVDKIPWTSSRMGAFRPRADKLDGRKLENSVFRGWNETLSDVYSCLFRALSKYEKWSEFELRQYSDLSRLIEEW